MDTERKDWNARQKELRALLSDPAHHTQAIALFLQQHAEVYASEISPQVEISFEDSVLEDLTNDQIREIQEREAHSIAWIIWHLARIEDVTMSKSVAGEQHLFD